MQAIDLFSLEQHQGDYASWPLSSQLFHHGQPTATRLPGYGFEAQYRCAAGYLLITHEDCPFEEANHFLLLDEHFRLLARQDLAHAYASHLLHAHWAISPWALRLHYYGDQIMTLSIAPRRWPWGSRWRLVLTPLEQPEADPLAQASIAELNQRLRAQRTEYET